MVNLTDRPPHSDADAVNLNRGGHGGPPLQNTSKDRECGRFCRGGPRWPPQELHSLLVFCTQAEAYP